MVLETLNGFIFLVGLVVLGGVFIGGIGVAIGTIYDFFTVDKNIEEDYDGDYYE